MSQAGRAHYEWARNEKRHSKSTPRLPGSSLRPLHWLPTLVCPTPSSYVHCTSSNYLYNSSAESIIQVLSKLGNNSNRVWTIKKDLSRLRLGCNGEEIFDIDTQPIINMDCIGQWSNDLTVVIFIDDTASDFYRQYTNGKF